MDAMKTKPHSKGQDMAETNDKPDIDWHTQLIETRGRRMGFAGANLDDAVQDITPRVLAFRYDAERSNGASLRTALTAVVDKSLLAIRRRESRYQKCLERARAAKRTNDVGEALVYEDPTPLRLDLQTALSQLSDLERQICEALSPGCPFVRLRPVWVVTGTASIGESPASAHDSPNWAWMDGWKHRDGERE